MTTITFQNQPDVVMKGCSSDAYKLPETGIPDQTWQQWKHDNTHGNETYTICIYGIQTYTIMYP